MNEPTESRGSLMREYNSRLAGLRKGQTETEVRELLGNPTDVVPREAISTPGDVFRELGSTFQLDQHELDFVWTYTDPYRPRVSHRIGFQNGHVVSIWKESFREPQQS